jgi:hypothetical protein
MGFCGGGIVVAVVGIIVEWFWKIPIVDPSPLKISGVVIRGTVEMVAFEIDKGVGEDVEDRADGLLRMGI